MSVFSICIYIPLCFYFIQNPGNQCSGRRHIYIPLCFYFITSRGCRWVRRRMNLHSTMLLLYRALFSLDYPDYQDLHSTMLLLYLIQWSGRETKGIFIYIPLCFYFISFRRCARWGPPPFTFHYASTLSNRLASASGAVPAFTFHYASTLSSSRVGRSRREIKFTFHYASTLSYPAPRFCIRAANLHSTMLLLYQIRSYVFSVIAIPFTFHYASTLSQQPGEPVHALP